MGSGEAPSSPEEFDAVISELHEKHRIELEKLTLTRHPFKTLTLFLFSTVQYFRQSLLYLLSRGGWVTGFSILSVAFGFLIVNVGESYEQLVQEFLHYFSFGLWWVALGIASSIGLGSGLHTFVLYLGPHIALFTVKAMACGRVDIKSAPYDTIQLRRGPSWLEKDCSEFGTPLYHLLPGSLVRVPVSRVLPKVQLEAILWGLGTALGELPPYFISRAARLSGSKLDTLEDLGVASSEEDGFGSAFLKRIQQWLLSHAQHLNFFTILLLASVPNPLFDLAGIMCGQFGIPFWKFFLATLIGKAIIKTYIQTVFIISLCNNQLVEWVENEVIGVVGLIPGISSVLPNIIAKLHKVQKKYFLTRSPAFLIDDDKAKSWNLSLIWNTVVWLMLLNFVCKIVTSVAQQYLREQQDLELKERQTSLRR